QPPAVCGNPLPRRTDARSSCFGLAPGGGGPRLTLLPESLRGYPPPPIPPTRGAPEPGGKRMKTLLRPTFVLVLLAAARGRPALRADTPAATEDRLAPLTRFVGEWEVDGKWSDGSPLHARA